MDFFLLPHPPAPRYCLLFRRWIKMWAGKINLAIIGLHIQAFSAHFNLRYQNIDWLL
jgi:hypothetical protein